MYGVAKLLAYLTHPSKYLLHLKKKKSYYWIILESKKVN